MDARPKVSIIIKALNEEKHIAACLEAAVREARSVQGEVVLVDSLSTDRTVEIAQRYPVRIIQFQNRDDCGCGAATQLGYQYARGDFIYVLDADMVLQPGFLKRALQILQEDISIAGVAGKLLDSQVRTIADKNRIAKTEQFQQIENVASLGGGGLYRREAIESAGGYLAHRGLVSLEESELGARLIASGWCLKRLPEVSVIHTGHEENNWQMLKRLWRAGRPQAIGVTLRSALGKKWCLRICYNQWFVFLTLGLHGLSLLLAASYSAISATLLIPFLLTESTLWLSVLATLSRRKASLALAAFSVLIWHYNTAAMLQGFFQKTADPLKPIAAQELNYQFSHKKTA